MSSEEKGVLAVFSGDCLKGVCGEPVGFADMCGNPLFVGDIVMTFSITKQALNGAQWLDYFPGDLTVVVSDQWTTYSDGTHVRKDGDPDYFVMGIKSVPIDEPGEWRVRLLKRHNDVVDGEHWSAYGFNYRPAPVAALKAAQGGE